MDEKALAAETVAKIVETPTSKALAAVREALGDAESYHAKGEKAVALTLLNSARRRLVDLKQAMEAE